MTRIANKIFEAMNELAEVRYIYQRVEPKYGLDAKQKKKALGHLGKAKKAIAAVEKAFKKKPKKQKRGR